MNPHEAADLRRLLDQYGLSPSADAVGPVGGGFSGAAVWRVETSLGPCCVRCWPVEHPAPDRLRWIHTVLRHAYDAGCRFLPIPLAALDGSTAIHFDGRLWEVSGWLPGRADAGPAVDEARLTATARAVAQFHSACDVEPWSAAFSEPSPGLRERLTILDRCLCGETTALQQATIPPAWPELIVHRDEFLRLFGPAATLVRPHLADVADRPLRLQPCIRDLRREHVLFVDDAVAGLVDWGAMQMEHPAADVARLLVEFAGDDEASRRTLLEAYLLEVDVRSADAVDPPLIAAFERSGTLLSPYHWLKWILLENRDFEDRRGVLHRLETLLARLRKLVETG